MSSSVDHKLPGEFVYDGITWNCQTKPELIEKVKTYPLEDGDVIVSSYTKGGTTWNQEILDLIVNDGKYDEKVSLTFRVPWLELSMPGIDLMDTLKPGRKLLKTHLSYPYYKQQVAEGKVKFIVPMRNLKDNLVSFYHFYRMNNLMGKFTGTWDDFFTLFQEKRVYSGDWLDFNLPWWNERHRANVHIVFYEDLKSNPEAEIRKIATFLGKNISDELLATIVQKTSFATMKKNPSTNFEEFTQFLDTSISPFMRKGQVGDWKNYFTTKQLEYIKQHYEPKLKAANLHFKDEV